MRYKHTNANRHTEIIKRVPGKKRGRQGERVWQKPIQKGTDNIRHIDNEEGNNTYLQASLPKAWKRSAFWNSKAEAASREKCKVREK